jgi:diguanylate cyclase (GGDEF)-like protein
MLAGFRHTFSLLLCIVSLSCLILGVNASRSIQWAQVVFAFSPAAVILTYTLLELSSGELTDPLLYILARQGLVLSLLLPMLVFGFEKAQKWLTLGECVVLLLLFDVVSGRIGDPRLASGTQMGLFTVLSMVQFAVLASTILYMQSYSLKHEQQVVQSTQKLQDLAIRDGMTGAFNRTFMERLIGDAINRSKRLKTPLSLLMIDVDHFKQINDTYGHRVGDEVLTSLAKLIDTSKRSTDYLGRWGGDELVLLLTGTNTQGAKLVAEKLRARVDGATFPQRNHVTISLGLSTYLEGENQAAFLERADASMYQAKRSGRNRVALHP